MHQKQRSDAKFAPRHFCIENIRYNSDKNESYDTIGIATFVLFFLSKMPLAQGFSVSG